MVIFTVRAQLVLSAGEDILHLFERLMLGGKAQVVGVDESAGGNSVEVAGHWCTL